MAVLHPPSPAQALFRVFVQPLLSQQAMSQPSLILTRQIRPSFLLSSRRTYKRGPTRGSTQTSVAPLKEMRTRRWDDEITARRIRLLDPETGKPSAISQRTRDVLANLDRSLYALEEVKRVDDENSDDLPICHLIKKEETLARLRQRQAEAKEKRRASLVAAVVKTLEINWAIDAHDLQHRIGKMVQFLREGKKVDVVLANKKKGRKASSEECRTVLKKIRDSAGEIPGAKETGIEGGLGAFCTLSFAGKAVHSETTAAEGEAEKEIPRSARVESQAA